MSVGLVTLNEDNEDSTGDATVGDRGILEADAAIGGVTATTGTLFPTSLVVALAEDALVISYL